MNITIEKPKEFFGYDYLKRLRSKFTQQLKDNNSPGKVNEPMSEFYLATLAYSLKYIGKNPKKYKTLDLGSGSGFVMAAFSIHNCPVYGIERNDKCIALQKKLWDELPIDQPLQVIHGNFFDPQIQKKEFPDGTKLSDLDIFHCYPYGMDNAYKVIVSVLAGEGKAKPGSIANIEGINPQDVPFLKNVGYEISQVRRGYPFLIKKVGSVN